MQVLEDVRAVMKNHPSNAGLEEYVFLIYDSVFFIWDFFLVAVQELAFTAISGVVAVSVIGFFLIPHWTATLFVTPLITILYVDLLGKFHRKQAMIDTCASSSTQQTVLSVSGTIQFAGLYINPVTYVCMVISIGLLVVSTG